MHDLLHTALGVDGTIVSIYYALVTNRAIGAWVFVKGIFAYKDVQEWAWDESEWHG